MSWNSAIYEGVVTHQRHRPRQHNFRYRMGYLYLDLDELPALMDAHPLWSAKGFAPGWFRRQDYFDQSTSPLAEAIRDKVHSSSGIRPTGPVRLLTHPRYWGVCFNPVSFYYVFDAAGSNLEWVVADVMNTPWREKHAYVLGPFGEADDQGGWRPTSRKVFHVSPFMEMDMEYRWIVRPPEENLLVVIQNHDREGQLFQASLALTRQPWTREGLGRLLWAYPWQSMKVINGIYWQALKLWAKKVPFVPHPGQAGERT